MSRTLFDHPLNQQPLRAFKAIYTNLTLPDVNAMPGTYRGAFIGPAWLRSIAPRGLQVAGLGGWWGKVLRSDGTGANLVERNGVLSEQFPIGYGQARSLIDRNPCMAIHYTPACPFPWPSVVDELRILDETSLLGMSLINWKAIHRLALPFLLTRIGSVDKDRAEEPGTWNTMQL